MFSTFQYNCLFYQLDVDNKVFQVIAECYASIAIKKL